MAVYKVIQDIEAEDKLLGPLTLKGFIYAAIAGVLIFIDVRLAMAGSLGQFRWAIIFILLFPIALFGVLASPLGREQPTEVWLLSHIRFLVKSRKRIWNQSGINHLVTITVPKQLERQLTKGFSQTEVKSRLQALATTLDSRGWAVKNVNINLDANPGYLQNLDGGADRLVGPSSLAQDAPVLDIHAKDDIMDETSNPTAQNFERLVEKAAIDRRKSILDTINTTRENIQGSGSSASSPSLAQQFAQDDDTDEELGDPALRDKHPHFQTKPSRSEELRLQERRKKMVEEEAIRSASLEAKARETAMTAARQADKIELAQSGNDLSVASLSKLANRHDQSPIEQISPNEVVISLH